MKRTVYAEFDDVIVYSDQIKERMLNALDTTNDYSKEIDLLILYLINQSVSQLPIDNKYVTKIMDRFTESVFEEIMIEKHGNK